MITIVGLGIKKGDLTLNAAEALCGGAQVILRTKVTPAAEYLAQKGVAFESLDDVYERTEDYDEVNEEIVQAVLDAAQQMTQNTGEGSAADLIKAMLKTWTPIGTIDQHYNGHFDGVFVDICWPGM